MGIHEGKVPEEVVKRILPEVFLSGTGAEDLDRLPGSDAAVEVQLTRLLADPANLARVARRAVEALNLEKPPQDNKIAGLSVRERQVALLAGEALTNRQIATRLGVSPHTVNFHLRQIFQKLGIASRVELVRVVNPAGPRLPV